MSSVANSENDLLTGVEIFIGDSSNAEARVYARLPLAFGGDQYRLSGSVIGPYCRYNHTLPAEIPLVDRGPGGGLLAQAIVPDPCFWSPELPMVYRAHIELQHAGRTVARAERLLGIKPLGVRGSQIVCEGKNLVLRAVRWDHVPPTPLSVWREQAAAIDIDEPNDAWLEEASQAGVWVIARIQRPDGELSAVVRRLARWPAVAMIALGSATGMRLSHPTGNCILAQIVPAAGLSTSEAWCQAVIASAEQAGEPAAATGLGSRPVLVERDSQFDNLAAARRACDLLQAELADRGQFAGYIV
jgi:hypothetical protein